MPEFDETKLSWRVKILPYMEQRALFEEFHLDEPWDSPHNFKLIGRMPKLFESPGVELPPGATCFIRPVEASDSLERRDELTPHQLENICWMLEVPPELAVPWTKPDDLSISDPRIKVFRPYLMAAQLDASCHSFEPDEVTPDKLKESFVFPTGDVEELQSRASH